MSSSRSAFHPSRIRVAPNRVAVAVAAAAALAATCVGKAGDPSPPTSPPPEPLPVQISLVTQHQGISGFGASSAWYAPSLTDAEADAFFSPDTGIGLSLLRVRITSAGTTDELATAKSAVARGVSVWAAPWSPPADLKSIDSTHKSTSPKGANAQAWANTLAAFAQGMAAAGVPLVALSAQNEPNFYTDKWDTCIYQPTDLVAFIRDNLGPALAALEPNLPILAPETQGWNSLASFADPILADPGAASYVGILATHDYGSGFPFVYPAAGKPVWETEVYDPAKQSDPGIDSGLTVAKMIHDHLVVGEVSAWHYWWLKDTAPDNGALMNAGQLTRRAYALGNWSRFVRPGFVRVDATPDPQYGVFVSAFVNPDPASNRLVIVAINQGSVDAEQVFSISGSVLPAAVTPWITSADLALAPAPAVPIADATFTFTLPGRSVTTFVGDP
jgi:glucuronoarabinoxylan endo-1,4-beta-xylanase